jgi:DNA polymerase-3 subunit beta
MITTLKVESEENGKVALPAKLILDVLKSLPEQPCTIRVNLENMQVEIAYDNGKSKMNGMKGDEFPKLPSIENKNSIPNSLINLNNYGYENLDYITD